MPALTPEQETLKQAAIAATSGKWSWWTSNSYLRLSSERGGDGDILHGARLSDGYCTVTISDENRAFIERANPATILALFAQLEASQPHPCPKQTPYGEAICGDCMEAKEEALSLHRQLAAEKLRADQGWERYEAANRSRQATENQLAALQQPAQAVPDGRYDELIYAVARKFPGETRHETALRYIRQAEANANSGSAAAVGAAPGEPGR